MNVNERNIYIITFFGISSSVGSSVVLAGVTSEAINPFDALTKSRDTWEKRFSGNNFQRLSTCPL